MAQQVNNPPAMQETQKTWFQSMDWENGNPLQYSCRKIPWTEEPGGLESKASQRVGHD